MLLEGCTSATGGLAQMGKFLLEANQRAALGESWRSPDALLKGFRNKNIHGLIDWRLGLDLLSVLRDADFVPGFSQDFEIASSAANGNWIDRANEAASMLALAMGEPESSICTLDKNPQIVGVVKMRVLILT